jgi:hypothetical protein
MKNGEDIMERVIERYGTECLKFEGGERVGPILKGDGDLINYFLKETDGLH